MPIDEIITKEEEQKVRQQAIKDTFDEDIAVEDIETLLQDDTDDTITDKEDDKEIDKSDTIIDNPDDKDIKDNSETIDALDTSSPSDDRFDKILSAVQTLNQTVSTMEGRLKQSERRIGGITNELSTAKKVAESQDNSPTEQQMKNAAETDDSWDDLKKNFPDWANAFESKLNDVTKNTVSKEDLAELRKTLKDSKTPDTSDMELKLVNLFHPHWREEVKTTEFSDWINAQSIDIINKYNHSTEAVDAIDVLNQYKESKITVTNNDDTKTDIKNIKAVREKRLKESVLEKTNHKTIKVKAEADMSESELRAHIAKKVFKD